MNNIVAANYWPVFAIIGVIVAFVVLLFIFKGSKRGRDDRRRLILKGIKEQNIPHLLAHNHSSPASIFLFIEEMTQEQGYSEAELGISLKDLLRHAIICQIHVLSTIRGSFESLRNTSIVHDRMHICAEDWARQGEKMVFEPIIQKLKLLDDAWKDTKTLNECLKRYDSFKSASPMKVAPKLA